MNVDTDGDGTMDEQDNDDDGDGIPDVDEGNGGTDTDDDGTPDSIDSDSDDDGIPDVVETGADTDGDGIPNNLDPDSDDDGIPDLVETAVDTDGDGIPNSLDPDSDDDVIPDLTETAVDTDGDGTPDRLDSDSDNDGIPDQTETALDTDGDAISNFRDADSDADGIPDLTETATDTDGDSAGNFLDLDSDNDGINDVREGGGSDADGNGFQDGAVDANGNGLVDTVDPASGGTPLPLPDTDGDLARDYLDLDSDNDTLSDVIENSVAGLDANNDGVLDGPDTDGDGIVNSADGSPLFGDAADAAPRNTDGTDVPDYIDADSDNSGSPDIASNGNAGLDADNDGRADSTTPDSDGDGIPQSVDSQPAAFGGLAGTFVPAATWQATHFTPGQIADPAIGGWNGDPDGDGSVNLAEYALGTDPKNPASFMLPVCTLIPDSGTSVLQVSIAKSPTARVFVGVEFSTELTGGWTQDPTVVDVTLENATMLTVRALGSVGAKPRHFARIRFLLP